MARKTVVIHTDGACSGNPGPGGFGAVMRHGRSLGTRQGAHPDTTNNQMELMGVIAALEALKQPCDVELHTDSRYVKDGITQWMHNWKRNGWKTSAKKPVANAELWRRLDRAAQRHAVDWRWVKGHAGNPDNEMADELARDAIDRMHAGSLQPVSLDESPADPLENVLVGGGKAGGRAAGKPKETAGGRVVVLASGSRYRRELMERLVLPFEAHDPGVDEDAVKAEGLTPEELVQRLARDKALALADRFPDAILIGSDQAPEAAGKVLDKPGTAAKAVKQLMALSGKTHRLLTALAMHDTRTGETLEHLDVHTIRVRKLKKAQVERYVERDKPLDCAGSYRFESLGIALFEGVEGEDATAIVGLPMIRLCAMLRELGVEPLDG